MNFFILNVDPVQAQDDFLNGRLNQAQITPIKISDQELNQVKITNNLNMIHYSVFSPPEDFIPDDQQKHVCFWCSEEFKGQSCGIPIYYFYHRNKHYFIMDGFYCNFRCALADYLLHKDEVIYLHSRVCFDQIELLLQQKIYPAPDRRLHQKFGGPLSSEAWTIYRSEKMDPFMKLQSIQPYKIDFNA